MRLNLLKRLPLWLVMLLVLCGFAFIEDAYALSEETDEVQPVIGNAALRFFDYYYDDELDDTVFPDYYGGLRINNDSSITFYLTDLSDEITSFITDICEDTSLQFEKVEYSFNYLSDVQEDVITKYGKSMGVIGSEISIESNSVVLHGNLSESNISFLENDYEVNCNLAIESETQNSVDITEESEFTAKSVEAELTATTSQFQAGLTTYRRPNGTGSSYTEAMGTTSFVALDSAGNKVIVTHGHSIDSYNNYLKVQGRKLYFNTLGISNFDDASYAYLPTSSTLTNYIGDTTYRLSGTMTMSSFRSISNPSVYFYGQATGAVTRLDFTAMAVDDGYILKSSGASTNVQSGDSGGPIFVSTSSGYQLIGIVKAGSSGWSQGVFLDYIKKLYYNDAGASLYVYVSNATYE